jgi:hypothetical protein
MGGYQAIRVEQGQAGPCTGQDRTSARMAKPWGGERELTRPLRVGGRRECPRNRL